MEERISELSEAFEDYRTELQKLSQKRKLTDGLFGFGHSIRNDGCHERFDERVEALVRQIAGNHPSPDEAEQAVRLLLVREDRLLWITEAQLMLRAEERHALMLIPYLRPESAGEWYKKYLACYKPWDRLPKQKEILAALKERSDDRETKPSVGVSRRDDS